MAELRAEAARLTDFARPPTIVAELALGWRYLLEFAFEVGAVTETQKNDLWQIGWDVFRAAGSAQTRLIAEFEPAAIFLQLLGAALIGGHAHVAARDGNAPDQAERWGWRSEKFVEGDEPSVVRLIPLGPLIGWLDENDLYVDPDNAYAVVQKLAQQKGETFSISLPTLKQRLREKGKLATTDRNREVLTVRRMLQGSRRNVLHLVPDAHPSLPDPRPTRPDDEDEANSTSPQRSGTSADPTTKADRCRSEPAQESCSQSGGGSGSSTDECSPDPHRVKGTGPKSESGRVGRGESTWDASGSWQEGEV
jgi:hypothetical protein